MKIKLLLIVCLLSLTPGGFVFAQGPEPGKYTGTYEFQEIFTDHINEALKELNYPVSYETDPGDFDQYPMQLTVLEDGSISLYFGDEEFMKSRSVTRRDDSLKVEFYDSYLGYSDELGVVYSLEGTLTGDTIRGSFTGKILQTGKIEARGIFEVSRGMDLDFITDFLSAEDSGEMTPAEEQTVGVTDILFDVTQKDLTVGEVQTLKATVFPREATNKVMTFTTTDSKVVRVSQEGEIRAMGPGEALIRVFSRDNPDEFDVMTVRVQEDFSKMDPEDRERYEAGMTLFEEEAPLEPDMASSPFDASQLSGKARERAGEVVDFIEKLETARDTLELEETAASTGLVVAGEREILESPQTTGPRVMDGIKSTYRLVREPAQKAVGKVMEKAGLDDFSGFVQEALDEQLMGLTDKRPKTEEELKEQLYKTFSSDNTHPALKYLQDKAASNVLVKPFAYLINKLTGSKVAHYREAVLTEYKSVRQSINRQIDAGLSREEAVKNARYDFVFNDNQEATLKAVEEAKPGFSRFFAMRQGGKQNQVATGSKSQYVDNQARFDKHLELMVLNEDLKGVE